MARIFTEGFEAYPVNHDLTIYSKYAYGAATIKNTDTTASPYGGVRMLRLGSWFVPVSLSTPLAEGYFRFAVWIMQGVLDVTLQVGATVQAKIHRNTGTGVLELYAGASLVASSVTPMAVGAWHVLEVHWDAAKAVQVRLNGNLDIDEVFDAAVAPDRIVIDAGGATIDYIDDMALNDATGDVDNSWCGSGRVIMIPVASDVTAAWTPSAGTDNYAMVDESPHDADTTYVTTDVADTLDVYGLAATPEVLEGKIIGRVWVEAVARKAEAGSEAGLVLGVKNGASVEDGTKQDLGVSYNVSRVLSSATVIAPGTSPARNWMWDDLADVQIRLKAVE